MKARKLIILLFAIFGFTKITIAQTTVPLEIEFGLRSGLPNAYTYSQIKDAGNYIITTETIWSQPLNCKLKVINKINGSTTYIENLDNVNFDSSFQITEAVYVANQNAYYFGLTIDQYSFNSETRIYKLDSSGLLTVISSSLNTEPNAIKKLYVKENYLFSIYKNKIIKTNISSFEQIQEIPLNILTNEGIIYEIGNDEFILHTYVVNSNNNYDVFLSKFNIDGQVLWEKTIAGSGNEFVANLIYLNGYTYICGTTNSSDGNFEGFEDWSLLESTKTGWISKLDSNGTLLWIKGFGGMEGLGGFQSLLIKDNYIFASGNCRSYYNYYSGFEYTYNTNIKTVKLDLNGNLIWEKKYGGFNNQEFSSFGIVHNQLVYTTRLWRYNFGGWGMFFYCQGDVTAETSGKFDNPLNFENPNQEDIWIFATDLDGIIQWNQLYGGESNDYPTSTIYNPQDLYVAASTQSSGYDVGDPIGYSDSWIFKLSANSSVNCNDLPTAQPQTFCSNATVANLAATGTNLQWYSSPTGGVALDNLSILTSGTYYVSQTSGVCESSRTAVAVTITQQVTPTFTPFASTCSGSSISPLPTTSDNGITGTWSPALNNNETTTYTFTPDAGQCAATTTQTINITTPKVTSPISFVAATLGALNCGSTSVAGTLTYGIAASSVSSSVPYTVGNGGSYQAQTIASTGVTGLTANLAAGTFATGAGNLTYTITGTPASSGTASFALNIGGQTCTLTLTVNSTVGTITDINCASAINSGTLTQGTAANGVSSVLSYTGGTGGAYSGQTVSSTGVTGLTATLNSGTFANGAGSLTYTITGTPASIEIASFPLNIGGQTCTLELTVQSSAIVFNPNLTYGNITDIDGNNYKTIQIGDKRWMAENLKVTKYSNGDIIPNITDGSTWYNSSSGAWAYYNNNSAYNTVYGKIYNGYAASDARNVCPSNWRVPNEQDWSSLEEFIGIPLNEISNTGYRGTDQAKKVKETGNRHWADLQGMFGDTIQNNATNEVGLTLIPTGYRGTPFGQFESINYSGYYWGNPWQSARFFLSYGNQIYKNVNDTEPFGMAIRCVKDETPPQGSISTLDCPGTTYNGTLNIGTSASGVSSLVHYTGGNGGTHSGQTVTSNGVTGLTATLAAGTFATGAGNLTYTITGTPASSGTASFALNIGGQTCTLTLTVTALPNVTIGTQIWTNKNLDISTYRDGTPIPQITKPDEWSSLTTGAWCYYNNDPANGEVYGKLYNWYAVAGIYDAASLNDPSLRKQLAPIGWHVPSDAEWTVVTDFLGGESIAGGKMKETGTNHWTSPNTGTTNTSGFTGLPGGYYFNYSSQFTNILDFGYWWSSSELGTDFAWYRNLYYNFGNAYRSNGNKTFGLSVRLIKD